MTRDPTMPRQLPPAVERALTEVMGWRNRPNPVDLYNAIRDVLVEAQETGEARVPGGVGSSAD
jgi:hypothetical protein